MYNELREDDPIATDRHLTPHPDMWEMVAFVAVLQRRGFCTKQDLQDVLVQATCAGTTSAQTPALSRKPYLSTNGNKPVLHNVLTMLHKNGLMPAREDRALGRVRHIIAQSERVVRKITR